MPGLFRNTTDSSIQIATIWLRLFDRLRPGAAGEVAAAITAATLGEALRQGHLSEEFVERIESLERLTTQDAHDLCDAFFDLLVGQIRARDRNGPARGNGEGPDDGVDHD